MHPFWKLVCVYVSMCMCACETIKMGWIQDGGYFWPRMRNKKGIGENDIGYGTKL